MPNAANPTAARPAPPPPRAPTASRLPGLPRLALGRRWQRALAEGPAALDVALPLAGPLRPAPVASRPAVAAPEKTASLQDQGVMGLQLRQVGDRAEVRLQWQDRGVVVEACLRETPRGVEIQLLGSGQSGLAHRVAETLATARGHAFELDGVEVATGDSFDDPRRQPEQARDDGGPKPGGSRRRTAAPDPLLGALAGGGYAR